MSKALQWIIGIGVVLMVVAFVFSSLAPFILPRLGVAGMPMMSGPYGRYGPSMPLMPRFMFGPGRLGFRSPFFSLFGLAACLSPLLLIGLIVLAISALTRRPAPMLAPPMAVPMPPAPVSRAACSHCGQPLQAGWKHCPSCGQPIVA